MFADNASAHEATDSSPFEMNTGRTPRLPHESTTMTKAVGPDANRSVISNHMERAKDILDRYWTRVKGQYDKSWRDVSLRPGSHVLVQLTDLERAKFLIRKLAPRWSAPALVKDVLTNQVTYTVEMADGSARTVHISRLLPLQQDLWGEAFPEGKAAVELARHSTRRVEEDEPMMMKVALILPQEPTAQAKPQLATPGTAAETGMTPRRGLAQGCRPGSTGAQMSTPSPAA
ncbi:hypothetical protein GNI_222470 [Gregarina niphandrodes]|uniref:Uncharacterized protein n=1 Tax=Gregarina niphandrodes TaxID=110365 RepID=A0A023AW17_GRENI|nr:hypothetical protein GNI_222470 [Gregarina niphandrodes]EZG42807.1 hypothetical protein GNI_222470 [Gregarina niphandrodes]|eukprot:XP_011133914.1 hypothetical protein GNI_222470 [Gregarina niphandrodes]